MNKKLLLLAMTLVLVLGVLAGCSSKGSPPSKTTTGNYKIVRRATLNNSWQMYQFELILPLNAAFDLDLLGLANNDKVSGYFYPESGSLATLSINAGSNTLYDSAATAGVISDRFSFSAAQPVGTAYVLNFKNTGTDEVTIFVEVIYPSSASIRGPLDLK